MSKVYSHVGRLEIAVDKIRPFIFHLLWAVDFAETFQKKGLVLCG